MGKIPDSFRVPCKGKGACTPLAADFVAGVTHQGFNALTMVMMVVMKVSPAVMTGK